jgi:hypothetical protein
MESFLQFSAPSPASLPKLAQTNKRSAVPSSRSTDPIDGTVGGRSARQQPASEPRAETNHKIWAVISLIHLFVCEVCEACFGRSCRNIKLDIVARELGRAFEDSANIINRKKEILLWQDVLALLESSINPKEIEGIVSGMSQENLALLSSEFGKTEELRWFADIAKKKLRDNFETELLGGLQTYYSIAIENSPDNLEIRENTLSSIRKLVESSMFSSQKALCESVEAVIIKATVNITQFSLPEKENKIGIANALVDFLRREVGSANRGDGNAQPVPLDSRETKGSSENKTYKPIHGGPMPRSMHRNNQPSVTSRSKWQAHGSNKISPYVKEVCSALSGLNNKSDENALGRAACSLIKLSSKISQEIPFSDIQSELKNQFGALNETAKKKLIASSSSCEVTNVELTGRKIRSSIVMKINQDAINSLNKYSRSVDKKHGLDDIQKDVDLILDAIASFEVEEVNVSISTVAVLGGRCNDESGENSIGSFSLPPQMHMFQA